MDSEELCGSLTALMEREVVLLEHMVSYELTLKESILSHNWTRLELAQRKVAPFLDEVAGVERKRNAAFAKLRAAVGEDEDAGLYEVLVHMNRELRDRAAEVYRRLKFTVLKIQGITNSIDIYLRTVTGAMQEILAELFPFRKGNIYTRHGTTSQAQANPMVFSRRL